MARIDNLNNFLTDVADSIREKTGKSDKITPSNFDTEIASIESGGDTSIEDGLVEGTITEYSNDRIKSIRGYCFRGSLLTSINIPNVTTVGVYAFYGSDLLKMVELSSPNVRNIKNESFRTCAILEVFSLPNVTSVPTLGTYVFTSTPISNGTGYIYVPDTLVGNFKSATNWSAYADQIKPISELEANS